MNVKISFILIILVSITLTAAVNISNLLTNRRFVEKQIDCILNRGHCDSIGKTIKGLLPEALNNNCRRCTPEQTEQARTMIEFMKRNYPNEWHSIVRHYGRMQKLYLKNTRDNGRTQ
ncbi:allergen Tha p 1 [Colletes latitarsis]|uniref:allergen Tha p 1 n=1 Tax=Colletes latitarsis TaxID=2605962 RepID=UPI0040358B80